MKYGLHWEAPYLYAFFKSASYIIKPETVEAWRWKGKKWGKSSIDISFYLKNLHMLFSCEEMRLDEQIQCVPISNDSISSDTPNSRINLHSALQLVKSKHDPFHYEPGEEEIPYQTWWNKFLEKRRGILEPFFDSFRKDIFKSAAWYGSNHAWELAKAFLRFEGLPELALTNHSLAYMIAFKNRMIRGLRWGKKEQFALAKQKRKKLVGLLGFPEKESTVRILAKVHPNACHYHSLLNLRQLLWDKSINDMLCRLSSINFVHINILMDPEMRTSVTFTFLQEISREFSPAHGISEEESQEADYMNLYITLRDTIRMIPTGSIQRISQLYRIHNQHIRENNRLIIRKEAEEDKRPFPPPPFPDNSCFHPITNALELFDEGYEQDHCGYLYLEDILTNNYYIYRRGEPERVTIGIRKENHTWILDQVKARSNGKPTKETILAVTNWLAEQKRMKPKEL